MNESADSRRRRRHRAPDKDEDLVVVTVSLSQYFADARALSYMAVPRRRRARWLAARLARRWSLPGPGPGPGPCPAPGPCSAPAPAPGLALLLRGRLLPPAERLRALEPGDTIQVIPQGKDWFLNEDDLTSSSEDETSAQKRQISEPPTPMQDNDEHEVRDLKRSQNETPGGVVIENASSTSSVVTQSDAPDDLRALKRRALELLDHCAPPESGPEPEPEPEPEPGPESEHEPEPETSLRPADVPDGAARPRRGRVRRRVRRLPPDPESPAPPPPASHDTDTTDADAEAEGAEGAVLMNGSGAQRDRRTRPRLVRPLH